MTEQQRRPVMLVVLDGWGWRESNTDNATRLAHTPTFNRLWGNGPHAFLAPSGEDGVAARHPRRAGRVSRHQS